MIISQLCIRYDIQLDAILLLKSANPEHMRSSVDADFVISDADMEILKNIERIQDDREHSRFPVFGGKHRQEEQR